jgi:hypothetical protein
MTKTLDDSFLDAAVERALAPLVGVLPPEMVDEKRKSLRLGLASHPRAQDILRRLRARPPGDQSGTVPTGGFREAEHDAERGTGEAR